VIRPNALGKFEDLLVATAKSPAMLMYLDNWQSVGPDSQAAFRPAMGLNEPAGEGRREGPGLNENYGRELMELHTLGVNGGYTQARRDRGGEGVYRMGNRHGRIRAGSSSLRSGGMSRARRWCWARRSRERRERGLQVLHMLAT
jgi:hypothetical protein